jgi:signal transduction histidine kinase
LSDSGGITVSNSAVLPRRAEWTRHRRTARRSPAPGLSTWQLVLLGGLGAGGAAAVGYVVSKNPHAAPVHGAVALRVALILTLMAAGIYDLSGRGRIPRMGALWVGAAVFCCGWLLNGSANRTAFSVGLLATGLAPTVFSYLILAYPTGHLRSSAERILVGVAGGALLLFWTAYTVSSEPALRTPLLSSPPPSDVFSAGALSGDLATVLKAGIWLSWGVLTFGTAALVSRALHSGRRPARGSWFPFELAVWANALCFFGFLAARAAGSPAAGTLGAVYVGSALAIPLAALITPALDRAVMVSALARFLGELAGDPHADLQALMARVFEDPSLTIAYFRPGVGTYVDSSGAPVELPERNPDRAVARIDPPHGPATAVIYDARLAGQGELMQAASAAATIHLDAEKLEAELNARSTQLAASRVRLLDAANLERQRIERDLHDGVQQQIVGLRLKLELATDALRLDPPRGERMLAAVGGELDDLLGALRSLAKGIYPSIIKERGLGAALSSMALNVPVPVSVSARKTGRYPDDIEIAVYFCCVEALQNVIKHAGAIPKVTVRLWHSDEWLRFEVRDEGCGFDQAVVPRGGGLTNMTDRIEAVGGQLWVVSRPGRGTAVRGKVPATGRR